MKLTVQEIKFVRTNRGLQLVHCATLLCTY